MERVVMPVKDFKFYLPLVLQVSCYHIRRNTHIFGLFFWLRLVLLPNLL